MAKQKQVKDVETVNENQAVRFSQNYYRKVIGFDQVIFSSLPSQKRRQLRFEHPTEITKLKELAGSIKAKGILQPPTARPLPDGKFELVLGERRIRAGIIAGLTETEFIVRDLTDQEAAEIQLIENIQRSDMHPIDEAFSYSDMQSQLKCDEIEIAHRTGKDVGYVKNCLLLLKLDETVLKLFEANEMTFRHALEFAKYPTAQKELLPLCFNNYSYESQSLKPYAKFVKSILSNYLLQLKKAPFSIKSTELHPDGVACVKCPTRTGAEPLLFTENFSDQDLCLDKICWKAKEKQHIQIQREKIAADKFGDGDVVKKSSKIPLISTNSYISDSVRAEMPKEKLLDSHKYEEIKKKTDECEFAEPGVFFNGDRIGQSQLICRNPKCKKHLGRYSSDTNSTDPEKEQENRKIRKEEIFDVKVGESVRKRVLRLCAEKFSEPNAAEDLNKMSPSFLVELLNRMWFWQASQEDKTEDVIREIAAKWIGDLPSAYKWRFSDSVKTTNNFLNKISAENYPKLLFLFLHAYKGAMFYGNWESQKEIKLLAEAYEVDYQKIDAEERLGQAAMKNKDIFRDYLQQIEAGNRDARIPRIWSTKWKPKD